MRFTNCYWNKQVRIPLLFSTNSASTFSYNSGQSVAVSLVLCVGPFPNSSFNRLLSTKTSGKTKTIMSELKKEFERLPKNVVPKHYSLTLTPNLKTFTFDGKVDIDIEVLYLYIQYWNVY